MLGKYLAIVSGFILVFLLIACESEDSQAIKELKNEYSSVIDKAIDMDAPYAAEENIDIEPKASGEAGNLEKIIRQAINVGIDFRNEYQSELVKVGWENLLEAQRIYDDNNLAQSKKILLDAKNIIQIYSENQDDVIIGLRELFINSELNEKDKAAGLKGFDENLEFTKLQSKNIWNLELQAYQVIEELVYWLADNMDDWKPENGQYAFYNNDKLDTFNQYLNNIQLIVDEQISLTKESMSRTSVALEKLEKAY